MDLGDMRVRDLQEIANMINQINETIHLFAAGACLDDSLNIEEDIDQTLEGFTGALPEGYWTVARIVALQAYKNVSERVLEGLMASQRSVGK